ncbi:hypothetical protein IWX49DRAFT_572804 [Phyllosticta citricarpa]
MACERQALLLSAMTLPWPSLCLIQFFPRLAGRNFSLHPLTTTSNAPAPPHHLCHPSARPGNLDLSRGPNCRENESRARPNTDAASFVDQVSEPVHAPRSIVINIDHVLTPWNIV